MDVCFLAKAQLPDSDQILLFFPLSLSLACPPACLRHRLSNACVSAAAQTGLFKVLSNDTLSLITYRMKVDQPSCGRGANRTRELQRRLDSFGPDSSGFFSYLETLCYVCVCPREGRRGRRREGGALMGDGGMCPASGSGT